MKAKGKSGPVRSWPNVRIDPALLEEVAKEASRHPMNPSTTQVVGLALREWLDRARAQREGKDKK